MNDSTRTLDVQREDLRLAFFHSTEGLEQACSLFSEDKEFKNIPCDDSPAPLSFITTEKGISLLKNKGTTFFQVKEPATRNTVSPRQLKALQEGKAVWVHSHFLGLVEVTFFLERVPIVMKKGSLYVKKEKTHGS